MLPTIPDVRTKCSQFPPMLRPFASQGQSSDAMVVSLSISRNQEMVDIHCGLVTEWQQARWLGDCDEQEVGPKKERHQLRLSSRRSATRAVLGIENRNLWSRPPSMLCITPTAAILRQPDCVTYVGLAACAFHKADITMPASDQKRCQLSHWHGQRNPDCFGAHRISWWRRWGSTRLSPSVLPGRVPHACCGHIRIRTQGVMLRGWKTYQQN